MLEADKVFAGSIPENYDRYMVPLIFEPFAANLAQRAASLSPSAVLETAAGTGVVTRALAPKLSPNASYVVTDLNQPMLDYAASRQSPDNRIKWRQADALALPFENATFDLVCCQFGAMFFPDRSSGYREAKRVLKPAGHFLFNVWDRIEENVFADEVTNALAKMFPNDPPRFLARTPHGYHDTALIRRELEHAGFIPAVAYCQGTVLRSEIEARDAGKLDDATDYVAAAIASRHGNGEVVAKIQAHVILAVA
jgi:ubiquinone/menaquinone biosynthesis C-methylase UbiE